MEKSHKEYSTKELDELCGIAPYIIADYDMDTSEVSNVEGIRTNIIDDNIKKKLKEEGGLVVFNN